MMGSSNWLRAQILSFAVILCFGICCASTGESIDHASRTINRRIARLSGNHLDSQANKAAILPRAPTPSTSLGPGTFEAAVKAGFISVTALWNWPTCLITTIERKTIQQIQAEGYYMNVNPVGEDDFMENKFKYYTQPGRKEVAIIEWHADTRTMANRDALMSVSYSLTTNVEAGEIEFNTYAHENMHMVEVPAPNQYKFSTIAAARLKQVRDGSASAVDWKTIFTTPFSKSDKTVIDFLAGKYNLQQAGSSATFLFQDPDPEQRKAAYAIMGLSAGVTILYTLLSLSNSIDAMLPMRYPYLVEINRISEDSLSYQHLYDDDFKDQWMFIFRFKGRIEMEAQGYLPV